MVQVQKLDGTMQEFKPGKLRRSLRRAGAGKETIDSILKKVRKILHEGIETKRLYDFVMKELKRQAPITSCKYDIKNALLQLGKEGKFFERFVGELLECKGYKTSLNRFVKGAHVTHEVDVIAKGNGEVIMVECKHHMKPWILGIQTALYVYARFLDVKKSFTRPLLVTNTTFSNQAIKYSSGVGLDLLGWSYPRKDSLQKNIEQFKWYPITLFHPIGQARIRRCMDAGIVSVPVFMRKNPKQLAKVLKVSRKKAESFLAMAESLCA